MIATVRPTAYLLPNRLLRLAMHNSTALTFAIHAIQKRHSRQSSSQGRLGSISTTPAARHMPIMTGAEGERIWRGTLPRFHNMRPATIGSI